MKIELKSPIYQFTKTTTSVRSIQLGLVNIAWRWFIGSERVTEPFPYFLFISWYVSWSNLAGSNLPWNHPYMASMYLSKFFHNRIFWMYRHWHLYESCIRSKAFIFTTSLLNTFFPISATGRTPSAVVNAKQPPGWRFLWILFMAAFLSLIQWITVLRNMISYCPDGKLMSYHQLGCTLCFGKSISLLQFESFSIRVYSHHLALWSNFLWQHFCEVFSPTSQVKNSGTFFNTYLIYQFYTQSSLYLTVSFIASCFWHSALQLAVYSLSSTFRLTADLTFESWLWIHVMCLRSTFA